MELDVLRTRGVLQDGEDSSHGAPEVVGIKGHGDVDCLSVAGVTIAESRGFMEEWDT